MAVLSYIRIINLRKGVGKAMLNNLTDAYPKIPAEIYATRLYQTLPPSTMEEAEKKLRGVSSPSLKLYLSIAQTL